MGKTYKGAGYGTMIVVNELYFSMETSGILYALATLAQTFPSGNRKWNLQLRINGLVVASVGGAAANDSPSISYAQAVPAITNHVEVLWSGEDTSVGLAACTLFTIATKK